MEKNRSMITISARAYEALAAYVKDKEKQGFPCSMTSEASKIILEAIKA